MERKRGYTRQKKRFLTANVLIFVGMVIVAYQLFTYAKKVYQDYRIDQQIVQYKTDIETLQSQNEELKELIDYLQTDAYREKIAKGVAGLKNPGEDVYIVKGQNPAANTESDSAAQEQQRYSLTNSQKWWDFFFGDRTQL